jgi:hypothetical protein
MNLDDSDRDAIDLLVRELTTKPVGPKAAARIGGQPPVAPPPSRVPESPLVAQQAEPRPGTRWTNVRLLMPSRRQPRAATRLAIAVASAASLMPVPDLTRFFRMPGSVTLVRLWVGLGALHCATMTFWPYPKTYFWGLVLYILSLGLAVVTGVWGARLSWDARLGAAHTVALGTVVWAVTLAAAETLPPV